MEEQKFSFSGSFKKTKEYIDTQVELIKLKAIARGSRILSSIIVDVTKVVFALFILFFLSMALGFYLSELFDSYSLGFLATAGIFLVLIIIINLTKRRLEIRLMDVSIRKILGKWHEEDDHMEEDRISRLRKMAKEAEEQSEMLKEEIEDLEEESNTINYEK